MTVAELMTLLTQLDSSKEVHVMLNGVSTGIGAILFTGNKPAITLVGEDTTGDLPWPDVTSIL